MKPTAELPGLGWTGNVHPGFKVYSPLDLPGVVWQHLSPQARAEQRAQEINQLATLDGPALDIMHQTMDEYASRMAGVLVQIGANDGVFDDPLRRLIEEYGLRAVLVEPQKAPFERLAELYTGNSNVTVINSAVSAKAGSMVLWSANLKGSDGLFGEAIAATNPRQIEREVLRCMGRDALRNLKLHKERVDVMTIADVCNEAGIDPNDIGIFVCDTEGHDAVITNALLDQVRPPSVLQYENLHVPRDQAVALRQRVVELGSVIVAETHKDTMAVAA